MSPSPEKPQTDTKGLELVLLFVCLLIAWPAFLLALLLWWLLIRHASRQTGYWIGAGVAGVVGVVLLARYAAPYALFLMALDDLVTLALHLSEANARHALAHLLPLWAWSVLLTPCCLLLLEVFRPKSLQARLLAQEQQQQAIQTRKSQQAARRVRTAPIQINGKGVLGALIDNPNT